MSTDWQKPTREEQEEYYINLAECLRSRDWTEVRGSQPGDRQGETMTDTFRRELKGALAYCDCDAHRSGLVEWCAKAY